MYIDPDDQVFRTIGLKRFASHAGLVSAPAACGSFLSRHRVARNAKTGIRVVFKYEALFIVNDRLVAPDLLAQLYDQ